MRTVCHAMIDLVRGYSKVSAMHLSTDPPGCPFLHLHTQPRVQHLPDKGR